MRRACSTLAFALGLFAVIGLSVLWAPAAPAQSSGAVPLAQQASALFDTAGGQVQIPIELYNRLVEEARDPERQPRQAPSGYALGSARVSVDATQPAARKSGMVRVELLVEILEDDWVLVPVLPPGTPVESASVDSQPVQLVATPHGLAWITKQAGSYRMSLSYRIDATPSAAGYSLPVPLPQAASINLDATLPGSGLDVTVIPAAGLRIQQRGENTGVQATVPTAAGVQIAWRTPSSRGHAISRATYAGTREGDAVVFVGELDVELFADDSVTLELLPRGVTLNDLQVDKEAAPILVESGSFATVVRGQGRHRIILGFQVPVVHSDGPPRIEVSIPAVPVSRFDLTLPGKKEVSVSPAATVSHRTRGSSTVATVFAPMTEHLSFSWAEAVPEEIRAEVRANAAIYHLVHAEEGVLNVRAQVLWEVTRGETNVIELDVPAGVQVNRIAAPSGAVADWRIPEGGAGDPSRRATVFLDRKIRGQLLFEVQYDRSLPSDVTTPIDLPLLRAPGAHRQRGMVALLTSRELALEPVADLAVTRVGENQLPPFAREGLDMTVAHTFKYVEEPPALAVLASVPERQVGRFDARVDTLVSLGEVTLDGSASVEVSLKSGTMMELSLVAPQGVSILNLAGPSIRDHQTSADGDRQRIDVQFTQEMEGQFRLEVAYERILAEGATEVEVPTLAVPGAEVEQGRIAIEALSAVEVRAAATEQLTALDIAELPRQLLLRTTNPILLAYKYVQSTPPHRLALAVTRHRLLDVQEAAIDRGEYRTLYTRDGLAVTIARFQVRNSRKQFLRIRLPEGAEVWGATVDGRPEQPALEVDDESSDRGALSVLLKIVNSTEGFPVELVYATRGSRVRGLGTVRGVLPRPDLLVSESRWDVFLPADMAYRRPKSNMEIVDAGVRMASEQMRAEMERLSADGVLDPPDALRIVVPVAGVGFAFEKLYANQSDELSWFKIPFASAAGAAAGRIASLFGVLLIWAGIGLRVRPVVPVGGRLALAAAVFGGVVVLVALGVYGVSPRPAFLLAMLLGAGVLAYRARHALLAWLSRVSASRRSATSDEAG